ncbi:ABC transporter substrate-binding protein [Clostridium sp. chh4-2]|uniref:extracellular solute-binding protein n=1 Tax=Clostridium sp. chh4-2 TaxID=2067550 RepID=UPI000CCEDA7A|nr:extracellular solute-binding protein [Clostridium sp. chh4-2]PNV61993.1 ABC transporter substrate-binding protein [Clostridium sp. chh4-2]
MKKRWLSLFVAAATVMTTVTGCGGGAKQEPAATSAAASQEASKETTTGASGETAAAAEFSYPMAAGDKLSYWAELQGTVSPNYSNLGETPFAKAWTGATGVEIEFMHPPAGQQKEQFSLILADGNLPDMMEYNWINDYPGGPEKAIKDGIIIPLNDVFEQYCPNITKYLAENPDIDKMIKTDDGHYYVFPFIRGDSKLCNTIGPMLRKDWLDELNLEVPTTIDEWHDVLTAFKEKKGSTAPWCPEYTRNDFKDNDPFAYAYNTCRSFYVGDDNKIYFGAVEENYKEYLKTMAQWYSEGLIDPDLATLQFDQVNAKMSNGTAGASLGFAGSRMGAWINAGITSEPDYMLVAAPYPTLEKGAQPEFGQIDNQYTGPASVAITTSCKDVERAARLLDYAYGEEGHILFNFGVEGESYTMVDGNPIYTDWILKNPDGWPVSQAMSAYIRGNYNGPFVQDLRYLTQYYTIDAQKETPNVWGATNARKHKVPPITPTSEESKEYSTIMNEINTYRDEMALKFIFGTESLDKFDEYVKNIENMGLSRALEIQNAALERYNAR